MGSADAELSILASPRLAFALCSFSVAECGILHPNFVRCLLPGGTILLRFVFFGLVGFVTANPKILRVAASLHDIVVEVKSHTVDLETSDS